MIEPSVQPTRRTGLRSPTITRSNSSPAHPPSYWVNDAPQAVHDLAAATPHGVRLDILTGASYSRSDLKAAGDRIMRDPIWRAIDLSSVAVNPDGSGLKVNLVGALPSASQRAAVADAAQIPASALEFRPDEGSIVQLPGKVAAAD